MGFEVVVRPVVFPNIRPAPAQSLTPQDDPDKGFATIHGNGAKQVTLSNSWSASSSQNKRTETKRRVDQTRVYQKNDDGSVNRENFVDIDVANKIWMKGGADPAVDNSGPPFVPIGTKMPVAINGRVIDFYRKPTEAENIEIKKRNKIIEAGQTPGN